jgi:hypothetical protein
MYRSEEILEGARAIRPYLSALLTEDVDKIDQTLADLLASAQSGQKVDNHIVKLLAEHEATQTWMREFLKEGRPPEVVKAYSPLPGFRPVEPPKYICPVKEDTVWYRLALEEQVPICCTCGVPLVLAK